MFLRKTLSLLLLFSGPLLSETVTTEPVGYNKVTCLANSDTIVGVPLRVQGSITTKLVAAPVVDPENSDLVTLTLHNSELPAYTPSTHYLKFNGGAADGRWYDITANTANSVTIDLNGDILPAVPSDNSVLIAEYWTLNTLFPPAQATTDPLTTGHAIVASSGTLAFQRRTEVLLPDLNNPGINAAPSIKFYIHKTTTTAIWKQPGLSEDYGGYRLYPDHYIIIRHPSSVTSSTVFRSLGEVELQNFVIPLATNPASARDTYVALLRPLDVTLSGLNLYQSGAFVPSSGTLAFQRRDQLLVFNNGLPAINKSASATYYHNGTKWMKAGDNTGNYDNEIIPAGAGFIIRKYQAAGGPTSYWHNTPSN